MPLFNGWFTSTRMRPRPRGEPAAAAAASQGNVGTLVSTDSLRTFGGLTVGISVVWGGIEKMLGLPHMMWLGGVLSLVAGAVLLWDDLTDANRLPVPRVPMRVFAALVNSFVLFGAASTAVSSAVPSVSPPTANSQPR